MAIKHILEKNPVQPPQIWLISHVLLYLEDVEPEINDLDKTLVVCEEMINQLVVVQVPNQASDIKDYKVDIKKVGEILERIVKKSNDFEKAFIFCLQTLYQLIVKMSGESQKPSAAAAIVFNIYDEELIPKAINLLLTSSPSNDVDEDVKKVIVTLCNWLRSSSGFTNLSKCIVDMLEGLRKLQKYDLLLDIAGQVIEAIFLAMIIPFIRPYVMPVVLHILSSVQHTPVIFNKIVLRIPNVFKAIENSAATPNDFDSSTVENLQCLVDIISALMLHYPWSDDYKEIEKTLEKHRPSDGFQDTLNVRPWHNYVAVPIRDLTIPVGLVNMGNTCYMNSVLQALFMTKQFTQEIFRLNFESQLVRSLQELLSLMLHSIRPYLIPRGVLSTRPPNFRNGYQQDSFEYLGYLLDQLYEEEKKYILRMENSRKNYLNNNDMDKHSEASSGIGSTDMESLLNGTTKINDPVPDKGMDMEVDTPTDDSTQASIKEENDSAIDDGFMEPESAPPSPPKEFSKNSTPVVNTLIQKTFTGKVAITYKCLNCSSESHNIDNFYDLQLGFPIHPEDMEETEYTTQTLLDGYFSTEKMVDDDKYFCEKCEMLCDGERDLNIVEGPSNLILVIKHFRYDRKFHIRRKLMHKVHHNETVGLRTVNKMGESTTLIYRLYAAIVHCGVNIDSGHYYTFGSDGADKWFKFNDSHISRSSLSELKNLNNLNTPYILFYELASTLKNETALLDFDVKVEMTNGVHENGFAHMLNDTNGLQESSPGKHSRQELTNSSENRQRSALLDLDNLPPMLRAYVNRDNTAYKNEIKRASSNRSDSDLVRNSFNGNKRSDNDQDPPSSCGQGQNVIVNRYLY